FAAATVVVVAQLAAIATVAEAVAVQAAVISVIQRLPTIISASPSGSDRKQAARDATENLRRAAVVVQTAAARKLPAAVRIDAERSLAAHLQSARAIEKLLAWLRRSQSNPQLALIASRLAQLQQSHAA